MGYGNFGLVKFDLNFIGSDFPNINGDVGKYKATTLKSGMKKGEFKDLQKKHNFLVKNISYSIETAQEVELLNDSNIRFLTLSGSGSYIQVYMSPEEFRTYKFFGMDVNENLDVIIKTHTGSILVANLLTHLRKDISDYVDEDFARNFDKESVKEFVFGLKLGKYDKNRADALVSHFTEHRSSSDTLSIIRAFLSNERKTVMDLGDVESKHADVHRRIFSTLYSLVNRYMLMKEIFSWIESYLDLLCAVEGKDYMQELQNSHMIANHSSILVGNNIFAGVGKTSVLNEGVTYGISASFLDTCRRNINSSYPTLTVDKFDIMMSMSNIDGDVDVYGMTEQDLLASAVLDIMAFKDEELIIRGIDWDAESKDVITSNILKVYKQKFREYYDEDVADALIGVIDSDDVNGIINIKNSYSDFSKDKDSLITSGKLVEKIFKRIVVLFE